VGQDVTGEFEATISRFSRYDVFMPNDLDVHPHPHLRLQSFGKAFICLSEGARLAGKRTMLFSAADTADNIAAYGVSFGRQII
jgi:hypothetical protein